MKELSVFVDESGDFGEYSYHSPYYIITMVFHEQSNDITQAIQKFNHELELLGLENEHCVHNGPIIRREPPYEYMDIRQRRKIFNKMVAFTKQLDISFKCFYIEKKHIKDSTEISQKLSKQISTFFQENYNDFFIYDKIKIYYDNGQIELTGILSVVLKEFLPQAEFRKVFPSDYRLFQVADLICTMELMRLKLESKAVSKSEMFFWGKESDFRKNYLKRVYQKEYVNQNFQY
ncbi:MAG: DUF3800 domain-containing protein [Lachnospiraceae bacterium]|nr:DUF3800 domain-containing protein [Lachnospiraceae bacterium]